MRCFLAVALLAFLAALPARADGPSSAKGLTREEILGLMDKARTNPTNGYQCSGEYCFVRAHLMARELIRAGADPKDVRKVIIRYPKGAKWYYHIAPEYKGDAVDPLLLAPRSISHWAESFAHGSPCRKGDPLCVDAPAVAVYGVVDRTYLNPWGVVPPPEQGPNQLLLSSRKAQLTYIYSLTGKDPSYDPARVDTDYPVVADSMIARNALTVGLVGVGGMVIVLIVKLEKRDRCQRAAAALAATPPVAAPESALTDGVSTSEPSPQSSDEIPSASTSP